jgi:hypothetical protein
MAKNPNGAIPSDASRYPLTWPIGWPRTPAEKRTSASSFREKTQKQKRVWENGTYVERMVDADKRVTMPTARDRLSAQLDHLGAEDAILSTNVELTVYGAPKGGRTEPADPGAAVYFVLGGVSRVLACDRWKGVAENIAALAAHIDAIRRVDRYGVGTLEQVFAGYTALPPPGADNRPGWRATLGFKPLATVTADDVRVNFRQLAKNAATDPDRLLTLNLARDAALRELGD